jgi:hypothetical protein
MWERELNMKKLILAALIFGASALAGCGGLCGSGNTTCGDGCMPDGDTCCDSSGDYCDAALPVCAGGLCWALDVKDPGAQDATGGVKASKAAPPDVSK